MRPVGRILGRVGRNIGRAAGRSRIGPVGGGDLEGVHHLAHSIAVRDAILVQVVDEIAHLGQRRGMRQVCGAVPVFSRKIDRVRRAACRTDPGGIRFRRCGGLRRIRQVRVHSIASNLA